MNKQKWYSLIDKVNRVKNLENAWKQVKANRGAAGIDGVIIKDFGKDIHGKIEKLSQYMMTKCYVPKPVSRVEIKKATCGIRPLGIPSIGDRVAQQSARNVLEPIFEPKFLDCSFGFRPGRSAHMAIDRIKLFLEAGYVWVIDADIKGFFDNVDHDWLIKFLGHDIADKKLIELIKKFLKVGIMDAGNYQESEQGTPQGGLCKASHNY
ncbi:MAG: reverse transcriptase domain-containing protein [Desulfitobacteriaceae bacterium]